MKHNSKYCSSNQLVAAFIIILILPMYTFLIYISGLIDIIKKPAQFEVESPKNVIKVELMRTIEILRPDKKIEYFKYLSNLPSSQKNHARIGHGQCLPLLKSNKTSNETQFILLTDFIPYFEEAHRNNSLISQQRPPTDEEIEARLYELVETLNGNLKHANIKAVYVFVNTVTAVEYLHSLSLSNSKNLVIQHEFVQHTFKTLVQYASECLQDQLVIIGQQDILFGKGWDKVSHKVMSERRLMYALTRQPAYQSNCYYGGKGSLNCKNNNYMGSHDVFAYHVKGFFTPKLLELLDMEQNKYGAENVFIWAFKEKLKYNVTNPCSILYTHHQHCVPLRAKDKNRARVNKANTTGMASFTDKLVP